MIAILIQLAGIATFLTLLYYVIKDFVIPWNNKRKKKAVAEDENDSKTEAVQTLGYDEFTVADVNINFGSVKESRQGTYFISEDLSEDEIEEEIDLVYPRAKLAPKARNLFPNNGWKEALFFMLSEKICREQGKENKAEHFREKGLEEDRDKYEILSSVWDNNNLEKALEEARVRLKNYNVNEGCVEEFLYVIEKWSEYNFDTLRCYNYDYTVSKVLNSKDGYMLLGRGGKIEWIGSAVDKILEDSNRRKESEKETVWDKDSDTVDAKAILLLNG